MGLFDVVNFKGKVVSLIYNEGEILIIEILWSNSCTPSILFDGDLWFFNDTNSITKVGDLTKVITVGDILYNTGLTESRLNFFAVNYRRKVTIGKVSVTTGS